MPWSTASTRSPRRLADYLRPLAEAAGFSLFLQTGRKATLTRVCGEEQLEITVDDPPLRLAYGPGGFAQVNLEQNRALVALLLSARDWQGSESALDLYCGMGNFSLPLARRIGSLVGVEDYPPSIASAQQNARQNGLGNLRFAARPAQGALQDFFPQTPPDLVVLDPPRSGAYEVARELAARPPERVAYVSCDPATLARDLQPLLHGPFRLLWSRPVDLFPQTYHIESLTLLERRPDREIQRVWPRCLRWRYNGSDCESLPEASMPILILCLLLVLGSPALAAGPEALALADGTTLQFTLPAGGWVFGRTPPDFLVRATVADLGGELAAKGQPASPARVEALARERLGENEGFVYQPTSESYLLIDFSPLQQGEKPPGEAAIAASARDAAEVLQQEEGTAEVVTNRRRVEFPGLSWAWRLDARYRQDGAPRRFVGIIGFRAPYWVFLYYTDKGVNAADYGQMEALLAGARIAARE